jgi:glutathione S-transferase
VLTGPFILRVWALPKYEHLVPGYVPRALQDRAPVFWKWVLAVVAETSVTAVWDEDLVVARTSDRVEKQRSVAS